MEQTLYKFWRKALSSYRRLRGMPPLLAFLLSGTFLFSHSAQAFPIEDLPKMTVNDTLALRGRLVFSASVKKGDQKIVLVDMSSKKGFVIIDGPRSDWSPVFHPNGEDILFVSDRNSGASLFVSNSDGELITQITPSNAKVGNPDWSKNPKERVVYYYKEVKGPRHTNIFSYDIDRGAETQLTFFDGRTSTPRISPDGTTLAYSTNRFWPGWDVCLFTIRNKHERCVLKGIDSYCRPTWSDDGSALLYSVGSNDSIVLGEYGINSGRKEIKASLPGRIYDGRYIDDDTYIFANNQSGTFNLYLKNKKGVFPLVEAPFDLRYPTWHKTSIMEQEVQRLKSGNE